MKNYAILNTDSNFVPIEVKRLSDNVIFRVGDLITLVTNGKIKGKILKMVKSAVPDNLSIVIENHLDSVYILNVVEHVQENNTKPLFKFALRDKVIIKLKQSEMVPVEIIGFICDAKMSEYGGNKYNINIHLDFDDMNDKKKDGTFEFQDIAECLIYPYL
jgi:hypothetical protein